MMWILPRSDTGAATEYARPTGCGVSTESGGRLPHGRLARLVLLWMYAEVLRTGGDAVDLGYSFCDYLWALRVRDELDLPEQAARLFGCTLHGEGWVSPMTRVSIVGWDHAKDDAWRGILPRRDAWVSLNAPVAEAMRAHPVRLCMHSLAALQHSAFALDVYLWDAWHAAAPGASVPGRLDAYRALAKGPALCTHEDALIAFEGDLHAVREQIARLAGEVSATPPGLVYALPAPAGSERVPDPVSGRGTPSPVSLA